MAQTPSTPPITLGDLIHPDTKRNPYAFYNHLRQQGRLTRLINVFGRGDGWLVTHYDDVIALLKDPRFVKDTRKYTRPQSGQPGSDAAEAADTQPSRAQRFAWRRDMLTTDPPDHTRLRQLVSKAFTPLMIEQLRPRIQQITDALMDAAEARGEMDLIADFAFPLPITVISEMLGIPETDRHQFRTWTQAIINSSIEVDQTASIAAEEAFLQYLKDLLASKRAEVGDDLISGMLQVEEHGDALSEYELISTIWLLIIAGHETTVNLIGNGTLALLEHPDQLHLLQRDPSLIVSAIEELLRYTAPVSLSSLRWADEDIVMHGQLIHKGDIVLVSLISANTDPQQFADPEVLDLTRQVNKHLAFGKGIHVCLGAPLARLEGQIAFETLLRRLPNLQLARDPAHLEWNRNPILRGLAGLPVTF
jgi:cytochrome P450 PksS